MDTWPIVPPPFVKGNREVVEYVLALAAGSMIPTRIVVSQAVAIPIYGVVCDAQLKTECDQAPHHPPTHHAYCCTLPMHACPRTLLLAPVPRGSRHVQPCARRIRHIPALEAYMAPSFSRNIMSQAGGAPVRGGWRFSVSELKRRKLDSQTSWQTVKCPDVHSVCFACADSDSGKCCLVYM